MGARRLVILPERQSPDRPCSRKFPEMLAVFGRIVQERIRQKRLLREGKLLFNCNSPFADDHRKLRVLMEEIGEVAHELDRMERRKDRRADLFAREDLQDELIRVAAVAVA